MLLMLETLSNKGRQSRLGGVAKLPDPMHKSEGRHGDIIMS
jgi:hypothetical protein